MIPRVKLAEKAAEVMRALKRKCGMLLFVQNSNPSNIHLPILYPIGDFQPDNPDILLGTVEDTPYYMHAIEFKYWQYTQLLIDVVTGIIHNRLSLENAIGYTFTIKSHFFTEDELTNVEPIVDKV